ncbi:MAG: 2-hydroxyacyl-CoA dehydratase, partial [Deltaproteobacteria bacterium HGW-Deltaproteobacteria-9]
MIVKMKEVANTLENTFIQKWKKDNGKVVGYSCTFIPPEIIHAAGLLPFRLRGTGITSLAIGDAYLSAVNCSVPKCMLQLAGQGSYKFLDGVVITNGCDSMRRLDDCWRKASEDYPGTRPGYFMYFSTPHKTKDYAIDFFETDLRDFIKSLEKHFEVSITDKNLRNSIKLYNEGRQLMQKLDDLRCRTKAPITGEDAMAILIGGQAIPRKQFNSMLKEFLADLEKAPSVLDGKKRLMLVGSANDDVDFVRVIEESGAIVVADSVCYGSRSYGSLVDDKDDPVKAIASHYLKSSICPRMYGFYKDRRAYLRDIIKKARVDGVILQNVRFCDLHGSENGVLERDFEAEGIPCMRLEKEYGPLVETGRVRMR